MESQGAANPGILILTTSLSKPFLRLDKYVTLLQELERHMEVGGMWGLLSRLCPLMLQELHPPSCKRYLCPLVFDHHIAKSTYHPPRRCSTSVGHLSD